MKFNFKCVLPALALIAGQFLVNVQGQAFDQSVSRFEAKLQDALAELAQIRESIAAEKIPLQRELNALEEEVIQKRSELRNAERDRDNKLLDLNSLKTEVKARNTEKDFLTSMFDQYIQQYETRIHITEYDIQKEQIAQIKEGSDKPDLSLSDRMETMASIIDMSLDRIDSVIGGKIFESEALSDSGKLVQGKVALVGPVAIFGSDSSEDAGLAQLRLNSPKPKIIAISEDATSAIKPFLASGSGSFPVDATMGNALKLAATKETWFEHIQKGGVVIIPMLILALISLVIGIIKWVQFARIKKATANDVKIILDHLDEGEDDEALKHAQSLSGPFGLMLSKGVENARNKKELIEEVVYEVMLDTKPKLDRALAFISLTAATSPLLGLLGTVTGMIKTFKMITVFGTGDPKTLSGGISEALVTTEYGLIIAVPTLILYALLSRGAKGILSQMELISVGFINGAPGDESENPDEKIAA